MSTPPVADRLVDARELGKVLGLHEDTVLLMAREGKIPRIKTGHRSVRFSFRDVMAALKTPPPG